MKTNTLALGALLLWLATLAAAAWFFINGNTAQGTDNRTAVILKPAERDLVLGEMRMLLQGTQGILAAVNANDLPAAAKAARAVGMASAVDINPALMAKLPLEFKQLGMSVHQSMDDLAAAAEAGQPASTVTTMLADTLARCVNCHAAWQLQAEK